MMLILAMANEISTMLPVQPLFGGLITIIRPLVLVPDDKIRRLAKTMHIPVMENQCPSSNRSKRAEVKAVIDALARKNSKVKGNIFRALSNYRPDYLLARTGPPE